MGTSEEVYNKPTNEFVAGFIGTPPMNFIQTPAGVIGIRPEHVHIYEAGTPNAREATVELVEFMGAEKLVFLNVSGERLIMKVTADTVILSGATLTVGWESEREHCFKGCV